VRSVEVQHQIKRTLCKPSAIAQIRALAQHTAGCHRTALAERVCAEFGFVDARGRAQRSGCLKALRELERTGHIVLPPPRTRPGRARPRGLGAAVAPPVGVPAQLAEIVDLELVLVQSVDHRRLWNELMAREHPRGAGPLVGCQLRYLVGSAHGWLGGVGFAAAALALAERDRWIGWNVAQRRAHLHRVVGLSRFLIRPSVHCHNLASHVLGRVLRVLAGDFETQFGYRPWLVESFVETPRHSGASYRAANWTRVGHTCGRGRQDRERTRGETVKAIYVYVLERDFRTPMGLAERSHSHGPLAPYEGLESTSWAQHEFGDAPLGDKRLSKRLVDSARRQAEEPMRAFTGVAKSDWAATKGYYRLIDQPLDSAVTPQNILRPHRERTVRRMQAQDTVLCIQDGTDLNYTKRPQCTGLGIIGTNQTGAHSRGLHLHSTLAVSTEGLPLGVLRAQYQAPEPAPKGAGARRALEDKKSFRWVEGLRDCVEVAQQIPDTRLVSVMDREGDFFELFEEQRRAPRVELLVRARYNRRIANDATLFETLRESPEQGRLEIAIGRQSARPKASKQKVKAKRAERIAEVALHYARVELAPTAPVHQDKPPIHLWVVHVLEHAPPQGVKPIEWFLLTTIAITSRAHAEQMLTWYGLRWRIEDWHRVLKTGCRIEQLGHDSAERLERATTLRLVIAWRIMLMTLLGREVPELPVELLFSELELKVLGAFAKTRKLRAPANLGEAVRMVARLGGYLARTHDPPPGHQLMWYGYTTLAGMCAGYELREELD
jgi:hypothetical protein